MKIRTDKIFYGFLGISLGMILLGLITLRFQFFSIGGVLILVGIILILMCFFTATKSKENL
ncbi:MAG: hypothetical protein KAJ93_04435 [Methanosarcinales archaeon]|nr:hypothetical protein [Methanosarcinales archaeon]